MKYQIPIIARIDAHERNSVRIYNNEQELIQDHPKSNVMRIGPDGKYQRVPISLTENQIRDILNSFSFPFLFNLYYRSFPPQQRNSLYCILVRFYFRHAQCSQFISI
jgi:hypothetical protein